MKTIGRIEKVRFPFFSDATDHYLLAKVDTGAESGALHVEDIIEEKDEDGISVLTFRPFSKSGKVTKTSQYQKVKVISSNGKSELRYRIFTEIEIAGSYYPINITLADRSAMEYDVIIGARFLQGKFLVDCSKAIAKEEE